MSVPQKWKYEVPQKWKKVFIWYMVLIEISQEGEASSPGMGKVYLSGKRKQFEISQEVETSSREVEMVFNW